MKRFFTLFFCLVMIMTLVACGGNSAENADGTGEGEDNPPETEVPGDSGSGSSADSITLWTYPIGNWGDESAVKELTDAFTAETGISVSVEYLNYTDGDDKVNTALTANEGPDVIMEGPERLVANWGANGYMVDLSDMLDDEDMSELYESVMSACVDASGACYEYPLVMTAHCMAVNFDAFVEAGADQYLNLETHTWTTEDFRNAVSALYDHYGSTVGAVFCGGQGGDQGTRALVNNLYGGTFATPDHTSYTWDDPENIKALELLSGMDGIEFDSSIVGADEIALFYNGTLKMAFCWNIAQQLDPNSAGTGAGLTVDGDRIVFMSFPSESGISELCGGIWGFGIFDNGDDAKIEAAKKFIKYMCDSSATADAVIAANYFAVRDSAEGTDLRNIWGASEIMQEYNILMPYLGDYYQVTTNWAEARTAWWNMLQEIGTGNDVETTVNVYVNDLNSGF